ncbi:hypothetical protein DPMN_044055 [Dreissena polymorpha]|uniref:C2H2-type domain-containing protein n=1 Tax=Dreissena polymorpha TaxID=45954 RepID=A0A9D4D292_DREPO|nr:hypothetical protein DPMN_044055 [Dreissena polymorpha]
MAIKCSYCNKAFPTIESLVDHLKQNVLNFLSCPYCSFKIADKNVILEHIKLCHPDKMRMVTVTVVCYEREKNFYVVPKSKKVPAQDGRNVDKTADEPSNIDITALLDNVQNSDTTDEPERMETHEQESGNEDVSDKISLPEADKPLMKERQNNSESMAAKNVEDSTHRIFSQNFSEGLRVTASEAQQSTRPTDHGLASEPVCEVTHKLELHSKGPSSEKKDNKTAYFVRIKCRLCRYEHTGLKVMTNHITAHSDHFQRFLCSECDYRASRYNVIRHMKRVCHPNRAKAIVDKTKLSACISSATKAEDLGESPVKPTGTFFTRFKFLRHHFQPLDTDEQQTV